ncbi:hypothetical protein, partial [Delftia acidovorans]|uniref:hypothetical protein n=1 Tax=Delftia acidovorans TaxID=80866 RepID=UPI002FDE79C1
WLNIQSAQWLKFGSARTLLAFEVDDAVGWHWPWLCLSSGGCFEIKKAAGAHHYVSASPGHARTGKEKARVERALGILVSASTGSRCLRS